MREGYFALLIPSKWEFSQSERGLFCIVDSWQMEDFSRICADHKASATHSTWFDKCSIPYLNQSTLMLSGLALL